MSQDSIRRLRYFLVGVHPILNFLLFLRIIAFDSCNLARISDRSAGNPIERHLFEHHRLIRYARPLQFYRLIARTFHL